jgi:hypothetical protein
LVKRWSKRNLSIACDNDKWCGNFEKTVLLFLPNLSILLLCGPAITDLGVITDCNRVENLHSFKNVYFIAVLFIIAQT